MRMCGGTRPRRRGATRSVGCRSSAPRCARTDPLIDLKRLRDEPPDRAGIERKRVRAGLIDELRAADDARRALLTEVEELRARQNAASKAIGQAPPDDRPAKIAAAGALKEALAAREPDLSGAEAAVRTLALVGPNPAHPH